MMGSNKVFLDFPEGEEFVLIKGPIEMLFNPNRDR
jgi:hypothetical protein